MFKRLRVLWSDQSAHGDGEIEPSERKFRTWVLAIAALVGPPLIFLLYYKIMFNGLFIPDALDFAQLGRNMSAGKGLTTYVLRPLALAHQGNNPLRQPDLIHGPLYPAVLAMAFGLAGAKDTVVAWVSGLFYLLTIPLIYRLAVKVFSRAVALFTVLIFVFNALMLEYAYSGMPITLEIFLSTWLLLVMYNISAYVRDHDEDQKPSLPKGQLAAAGVLMGLLYLTDTIFLFYVPIAAAWVFWLFFGSEAMAPQRLRALGRFLIFFGIMALPLMIRYALLHVNPLFGLRISEVWMNTAQYPEYSAYRHMPGELIMGPGLFKSVVTKILLGIGRIIQEFPKISASWILAFFLPSLLFRFSDPAVNRLRQATILLWVALMVGMLLFGINLPLFVTTTPAMLAFAVAYLLYLIRQAQMRWQGVSVTAVLLGMVVVLPLLNALFLSEKPKDISHEAIAATGFGKTIAKEKVDTAFSDMPQVVAWYANRPAIYIPMNDPKILNLRKRFKDARWLFLTERVKTFGAEWEPIYAQMEQWNLEYQERKNQNLPPPQFKGIFNAPESNPFYYALNGFYSVPPVKGGKKVAILASNGPADAAAPPTNQPGTAPAPGTPTQDSPSQGATGPSEPTRSADARGAGNG